MCPCTSLKAEDENALFNKTLNVIDHFTVADLVTWPLNGSEAGVVDTDLTAFIV